MNDDNRFRTAPPVSRTVGPQGAVIDGYGFKWCRTGQHIIPDGHNACKPCQAHGARAVRRRKRTFDIPEQSE